MDSIVSPAMAEDLDKVGEAIECLSSMCRCTIRESMDLHLILDLVVVLVIY